MPRYLAKDYLNEAIEHYQEFILFEVNVPKCEGDPLQKVQAYRRPWTHAKPRQVENAQTVSEILDTLCERGRPDFDNLVKSSRFSIDRFEVIPSSNPASQESGPLDFHPFLHNDLEEFSYADNDIGKLIKNGDELMLEQPVSFNRNLERKKSHLESMKLCPKNVSDPFTSGRGKSVDVKDMMMHNATRTNNTASDVMVEERFLALPWPSFLDELALEEISLTSDSTSSDWCDHEADQPQCLDLTITKGATAPDQVKRKDDESSRLFEDIMHDILETVSKEDNVPNVPFKRDAGSCQQSAKKVDSVSTLTIDVEEIEDLREIAADMACIDPVYDQVDNVEGSKVQITEDESKNLLNEDTDMPEQPSSQIKLSDKNNLNLQESSQDSSQSRLQPVLGGDIEKSDITDSIQRMESGQPISEENMEISDISDYVESVEGSDEKGTIDEQLEKVVDLSELKPHSQKAVSSPIPVTESKSQDKRDDISTKKAQILPVSVQPLSKTSEDFPSTNLVSAEKETSSGAAVNETEQEIHQRPSPGSAKDPVLPEEKSIYFSKPKMKKANSEVCMAAGTAMFFARKPAISSFSTAAHAKDNSITAKASVDQHDTLPADMVTDSDAVVDLSCKPRLLNLPKISGTVHDKLNTNIQNSQQNSMETSKSCGLSKTSEVPVVSQEVLDLTVKKDIKSASLDIKFVKLDKKAIPEILEDSKTKEIATTTTHLDFQHWSNFGRLDETHGLKTNAQANEPKREKIGIAKNNHCEVPDKPPSKPFDKPSLDEPRKRIQESSKKKRSASKQNCSDPIEKSLPLNKVDPDDLLDNFIKKRTAEQAAEEEYVIRKIKLSDSKVNCGWKTPERKPDNVSPSTASTVSTPSEWSTVVIQVELSEAYIKLLSTIATHAEPRRKCLSERDIISKEDSFISLQPQDTLQLVQQYKALKTQGNSDVYQALSSLHVLVTISHLVQCCSATVAVTELQDLLQRKTHFADDFRSLCDKLQSCIRDKETYDFSTHPKIFRMIEYIKKWQSSKDMKSPDHDNKILVIVNNKSMVLMKEIEEKLAKTGNIRPITHPRKTKLAYEDVMTKLEHCNCLLIQSGDIGEDFPWAQFSVAMEYDPYPTCNRLELIARQSIRYIALQVNLVPIEKITTMMETDKATPVTDTPPEGCETYIVSQRVIEDVKLCHVLESGFNMQLIERDYSCLETKGLIFADIIIDERTCIVLFDSSDFPGCLALVKSKLTALSLKYSSCWLLVTFYNCGNKCLYGGGLIQQLSQMQHRISECLIGLTGFTAKLFSAQSINETAQCIKKIGQTALEENPVWTQEHWFNRHWVSPHVSRHENLLLHFPCLNSFSAQILLTFAPLKDLIAMSQDSLKECVWLPSKTIQSFRSLAHNNFDTDTLSISSSELRPDCKEMGPRGDQADFNLGIDLENSPKLTGLPKCQEMNLSRTENYVMKQRNLRSSPEKTNAVGDMEQRIMTTNQRLITENQNYTEIPTYVDGRHYTDYNDMRESPPQEVPDQLMSQSPARYEQDIGDSQPSTGTFSFLEKAVNEASEEVHNLPNFRRTEKSYTSPGELIEEQQIYQRSNHWDQPGMDYEGMSLSRKRSYPSQLSPLSSHHKHLVKDSPDFQHGQYPNHDNLRLWTQFDDRLSKKPQINESLQSQAYNSYSHVRRDPFSQESSYSHLPPMQDISEPSPRDQDYRLQCANYPVCSNSIAPSTSTPVGRAKPLPRLTSLLTDSPPMDLDRDSSYWTNFQPQKDMCRDPHEYYTHSRNYNTFQEVNFAPEYCSQMEFGGKQAKEQESANSAWPRKLRYERVDGVSNGQTRLTFR